MKLEDKPGPGAAQLDLEDEIGVTGGMVPRGGVGGSEGTEVLHDGREDAAGGEEVPSEPAAPPEPHPPAIVEPAAEAQPESGPTPAPAGSVSSDPLRPYAGLKDNPYRDKPEAALREEYWDEKGRIGVHESCLARPQAYKKHDMARQEIEAGEARQALRREAAEARGIELEPGSAAAAGAQGSRRRARRMSGLWNSLRTKGRTVDWFGPIPIAAVIAGVLVLLLWVFSGWYGGAPGEIFRGFYVEAGGAVMDYRRLRHRPCRPRSCDLPAPGNHPADGADRRLQEMGLRRGALPDRRRDQKAEQAEPHRDRLFGIEISDFRFRWLEIESIAGSTFYDGSWGTWSGKDSVTLTGVDFSGVDCRGCRVLQIQPFSTSQGTAPSCHVQGLQFPGDPVAGCCIPRGMPRMVGNSTGRNGRVGRYG